MKRTAVFAIVLLLGLLLASGCVSTPTSPVPGTPAPVPQEGRSRYVIGVDGNYPPFTYRDDSGNFTGFDIEAARWIADREGFDAEFVAVPWAGIIPALQEGSIDMIYSGMTVTLERQKVVEFTTPYYTVNKSVAVRAGSNHTMDDLYAGRLRVGAETGSTSETWVERNLVATGRMPASSMVLYSGISELTDGLVKGEIDASVNEAPTQKLIIAGKPLVILGEIPTQEQYAVAVRKTDPGIKAMLDDGLQRLKADPYWQELREKYGL
jgi:polar amino acid transport system substrate-binding protein